MGRAYMKIICLLLVAVLAACATGCDTRDTSRFAEIKAPSFPWSSFMRFWNSRTASGLEIQNPQKVNDTWVAQYHSSVSLIVGMRKDTVHTVTAAFVEPRAEATGGQIWLRLVNGIITVGTYGWPQERITEVKEKFTGISPVTVEYSWQYCSFRREFNPTTGWTFTLEILSKPAFSTGPESRHVLYSYR